MWYGKDTPELIKLKKKYEEVTGYRADGEMEVEYGQADYQMYVNDLKTCISKGITLGDLYPDDGDWF